MSAREAARGLGPAATEHDVFACIIAARLPLPLPSPEEIADEVAALRRLYGPHGPNTDGLPTINPMGNFELFNSILKRICTAGAEAIERYAEVSRTDPVSDRMPELFLESIILDRLGPKKDASGLKLRLQATLAALGAAQGQNERPDLAVYHPDDPASLLGLVEFKRDASDLTSARETLSRHITRLNLPLFGAVCAMHGDHVGERAYIGTLEKLSHESGDTWHCVEANLPVGVNTKYPKHYFFARGFEPTSVKSA